MRKGGKWVMKDFEKLAFDNLQQLIIGISLSN